MKVEPLQGPRNQSSQAMEDGGYPPASVLMMEGELSALHHLQMKGPDLMIPEGAPRQ